MGGASLETYFPGYYWPSEEHFQQLWDEGVLVLDASFLLSFYRYSEDALEPMFRILRRFNGRVFVPHQAAEEFQRNRVGVISQQIRMYDDFRRDVEKSVATLRDQATQFRRHPALDPDEISARIDTFAENLTAYISERRQDHPNLAATATSLMRDPIRSRISDAVGEGVGSPYSEDRRRELELLAQDRYETEVPPGYKDSDKGGTRQFGDALFWFQTLEFATETHRPIVIVTDDEKEDWWWSSLGKTLGPRVELVAEMRAVASQPMFMYTSRTLLEAAKRYLAEAVSDAAVEEVTEVAKELLGRVVAEGTVCPYCSRRPVVARLGVLTGSSAIAHCPSCEHRFHVHRVSGGEIRTSRGSLGRRVRVACPDCGAEVHTNFADGDTSPRLRFCLECAATLRVDSNGVAEIVLRSEKVEARRLDDRHLQCPRCDAAHPTVAERRGELFARCELAEPPWLLWSPVEEFTDASTSTG